MLGPCPPQGIVLDCDSDPYGELGLLARAFEKQSYPTPVLLWSGLSSQVLSAVAQYHTRFCDIRLALRGFDSLPTMVRALFADSPTPSRLEIICRVQNVVAEPALSTIARAALLGESCRSVADLARVCATSVRTVESRLSRQCPLAAKAILMWMLALHTAWRVERLGCTGKTAAAAAGLKSERLLSNRMERITGLRAADFGCRISFTQLLDRFVAILRNGPHAPESNNVH
jgi:hypothetical protein